MGVYHYHALDKKFDLFILIHPLDGSPVERKLQELARSDLHATALLSTIYDDPWKLHVLPFASYLGNWRWYFRYLGADFQERVLKFSSLPQRLLANGSKER